MTKRSKVSTAELKTGANKRKSGFFHSVSLPIAIGFALFSGLGALTELAAQANNNNNANNNSKTSSRSTRSSTRSTTARSNRSTDGTGANAADKNRVTSARDRLRERQSRATGTPAAGTPAADAKKTVEGKKPESGGGSKSGAKRPLTNVEFKMQVDPNTNIMYLEGIGTNPSLNIQTTEEEKFITRLTIYNPRQNGFDEIRATIKYDPTVIKPIGIDDSMIASQLLNPSTARIDSNNGLLIFEARFKEESRGTFNAIAKIEWKALKPAPVSALRFINNGQYVSGVFSESGQNILHMREDGQVETSSNAGLLDSVVAVNPSDSTAEILQADTSDFASVVLASNISEGTAKGKMQLSLVPRKNSITVGDPFLVDVKYSNPAQAEFDTVNLSISFDPSVFEVLDADEGNWITRGVNIFDGDYHMNLPFDYHRKNTVLNNIGLIQYEKGFQSKTMVPEHGTIATIKMVAKRPVQNSKISFNIANDDGKPTDTKKTTAISFLGFNLIGVPGQRTSYANPAVISVSDIIAKSQ